MEGKEKVVSHSQGGTGAEGTKCGQAVPEDSWRGHCSWQMGLGGGSPWMSKVLRGRKTCGPRRVPPSFLIQASGAQSFEAGSEYGGWLCSGAASEGGRQGWLTRRSRGKQTIGGDLEGEVLQGIGWPGAF